MQRLRRFFCLLLLAALPWPAFADKLAVVVPLAADDQVAVKQLVQAPGRHVLVYFGDELN